MKDLFIIGLISLFILSACARCPKRSTDEAMLSFLPYLNQKMAGYIDSHDIKSLDMKTYKDIVNQACVPLPTCGKNAEILFNTYDMQVRSLDDGMFSMMLCDKDGNIKKMEDFSCNEHKVEITNFRSGVKARCTFEANWKEKVTPYCPELK